METDFLLEDMARTAASISYAIKLKTEYPKEIIMNNTKTEGTVSLSISELDRLRSQISELGKERDELKSHVKEVKLNIVVEEEYLTTRSVPDWNRKTFDRWGIPEKLEAVKEKHILSQNESYIGLGEVITELRREEEAKVIQKLGNLDRQILELKNREEALKTEQAKKISEIRQRRDKDIEEAGKMHKEEVDTIKTELGNIIKDLTKQINDLNGVITDQSKDDIIRQLKTEIETLKLKKGFWSFLHS